MDIARSTHEDPLELSPEVEPEHEVGISPGEADEHAHHRAAKSSAIKDLFGRGLLYTIIYAVQSAAGIIFTPIITRLLGPSAYGQVALIILTAQVITGVAGLGMQIAVQREYADEGGPESCRGLVMTSALLTLAITGIFVVTGTFWARVVGFHSYDHALQLGVCWAGLSALGLVVTSLLRAHDRLASFVIVIGIQFVGSQIAGLIMMVLIARTAEVYLLGLLLGQLIGTVLGLVLVKPSFQRRSWHITRKALSFSLPVVPHSLAFIVLALGDRVVVKYFLGSSAVGRYQIAYNAGGVMIILLGVLNLAWEPRIFAIKDENLLASVLSSARSHLYRLQIPLLLATVLVAPVMLRILAPASFDPDSLMVVVALVACSGLAFSAYLSNLRVLLSNRRTASMVWVSPVCAVANIGLNILLVPILGINGSALATLISYMMLAAVTGFIARRMMELQPEPVGTWVAVGAAAALGLGIAYIPSTRASIIVEAVVGVLCALWALLVLRRISDPVGTGDRATRRHALVTGRKRMMRKVLYGSDLA